MKRFILVGVYSAQSCQTSKRWQNQGVETATFKTREKAESAKKNWLAHEFGKPYSWSKDGKHVITCTFSHVEIIELDLPEPA